MVFMCSMEKKNYNTYEILIGNEIKNDHENLL